jgi:hypothetical protein
MRFIFIFIICLLMNFASVRSEEVIQEPVPPVARETEDSTHCETYGHAPDNNVLHRQPIVAERKITAESLNIETEKKKTYGNAESSKWTDPLTFLTGALVVLGFLQWLTYHEQLRATKIMERAYVTLSHVPLQEGAFDKVAGRFQLITQAKNFGRTPTTLIEAVLIPLILPVGHSLPKVPDYQRPERKRESLNVFLFATDECFTSWDFPLALADISGIEDGRKRLWLYGYINYRDKFGCYHRAGYARVYILGKGLRFITQDGYNYDCPKG